MMTLEELQHLAIGDLLQYKNNETYKLWQICSNPEYYEKSVETPTPFRPDVNYTSYSNYCKFDIMHVYNNCNIIRDYIFLELYLDSWTLISKALDNDVNLRKAN